MPKIFSFLLFLFFICFDSEAQSPVNLTSNDLNNLLLKEIANDALTRQKDELVKVNGSIYLNDNFANGEVKTDKGNFNPINMRYNIRDDVFQFKMGSQLLLLDPIFSILLVSLNKEEYVVKTYTFQGKTVTGFLEQLVKGKYSLYAKKNITFRPAKPPKALESEPTLASYTRPSDTYYFEFPDGKLEKIKNGKDIIYLIRNPKLEDLVKSKKLSLRKDRDLVQITNMLNAQVF